MSPSAISHRASTSVTFACVECYLERGIVALSHGQSSHQRVAVRPSCWTSSDEFAVGIMRVTIVLEQETGPPVSDAVLRLSVRDYPPATLDKRVRLDDGTQELWIGVHTHLLPADTYQLV